MWDSANTLLGHRALFAPIEVSQVSDARFFAKLRTDFGAPLEGLPSLKGLGFFPHSTQHSAYGSVLG